MRNPLKVSGRINLLYVAILVVIGSAIGLMVFNNDPKQSPPTQPTNFNTISDSSTGISFNMSKAFQPIPKEELAALNPGFNYGFRPSGDTLASCIVSQTRLSGSGSLTGDQLRDGILKEVKKIHPDAKLTNPTTASNPVKFGEARGVLLQLTYKEGATEIERVEILALGKTTQVIAYCQSLAADNQRYYDDFTIFFSSLKLGL